MTERNPVNYPIAHLAQRDQAIRDRAFREAASVAARYENALGENAPELIMDDILALVGTPDATAGAGR